MNDYRDLILSDLETKFNSNTGEVIFKVGEMIEVYDGLFELETIEGIEVITTDFSPISAPIMEGNKTFVGGKEVFSHDIMLEVYAPEENFGEVYAALDEIAQTLLDKKSYTLVGDIKIQYTAGQPLPGDIEIMNKSNYILILVPIVTMLGENINFSSEIEISMKEKGSGVASIRLPIIEGSVSVSGDIYAAQIIGEEESKAIITDRAWGLSVSVIYSTDAVVDSLFKHINLDTNQNTVYELEIKYTDTISDVRDIIITEVNTSINTAGLLTFTVGMISAAVVI